MRKWGWTVLAALLLSLLTGVTGCSSPRYSEAQIGAALAELIPQSYTINEIYFGEGLPVSGDRETVVGFYKSLDVDEGSVNYHPVAEDCGYASIEEIKEATLAVYTDAYAEYLFARAFTGVSDTLYNMKLEAEAKTSVSYARYLESEGYLTVRINLAEEALPLNRTYDTADFRILRIKDNYVLTEVQSYVDGQKDVPVELKLVITESGFRLDTPTY